MPKTSTQNIEVDVRSAFVPEKSNPEKAYYFFAYTIRITNLGGPPAKLLNRHWIITDGLGRVHEVKGEGVVGAQPYLAAGQTFEYTSYCPLPTPSGSMQGTYEMALDSGERFNARIPMFVLIDPNALN